MAVTTTSKLEKAQEWAKDSIGKHHRVRVNKNTVWAGSIATCEVVVHSETGRPLCFEVVLETPSGHRTRPFNVLKLPA